MYIYDYDFQMHYAAKIATLATLKACGSVLLSQLFPPGSLAETHSTAILSH